MIRTAAPEPSASRSGTPTVVVVVAGKERAPDVRASLRRYEEDDLDVLGVVLHAPVPEGSGDTDAYFADEDGEGSTGPRAVAS